jgi:hypothetical protein
MRHPPWCRPKQVNPRHRLLVPPAKRFQPKNGGERRYDRLGYDRKGMSSLLSRCMTFSYRGRPASEATAIGAPPPRSSPGLGARLCFRQRGESESRESRAQPVRPPAMDFEVGQLCARAAVPDCVDDVQAPERNARCERLSRAIEGQPRGRRPLARRCRATEAGRSGGDDCSARERSRPSPSFSFRFTSPTTRSRSVAIPVRYSAYASSMMRRMRCQSAPVMTRRLLSSPRLPATHAPPRSMVLPAAHVGQAYPPVGSQPDAHRDPRRSVDHQLGWLSLVTAAPLGSVAQVVERDDVVALEPLKQTEAVGWRPAREPTVDRQALENARRTRGCDGPLDT